MDKVGIFCCNWSQCPNEALPVVVAFGWFRMGMVSGSVKSHSCMRCKVEATAFVTMILGAECIGYVPKVSLMSTWISDDTSHMLILLPRSHQFVAPILVPGAPFLTKRLGNVQPKELVVG